MSIDGLDDKDTLRSAAKLLDAENRKLMRENLELKRKIDVLEGKDVASTQQVLNLEHQIAVRNKMLFGDKSEKRPNTDADLPKLTLHEDADGTPLPQRGHGPNAQVTLPSIEQVEELDVADRVCKACGDTLTEWKGQTEDAEVIEMVRRHFIRVAVKRKKYRCKCGACIETAPPPNKLIPGGRYGPSVAIAVAIDKYADHLPLERQATIMSRQGLAITSQTLWDQLEALATKLTPAYERLLRYVREKPVVGADETPWKVLGNQGKSTKKGYVWALCADDAVVYRFDESRSAEAAKAILGDFKGSLVCDGYTVYESLKKQGMPVRIAHCWAHVRRKFVEAEASAPKECAAVLNLIGALYGVERQAAQALSLETRLALRKEKAKPIVDAIGLWARETPSLPQSPLGKSIGYMTSLWRGLQVFLDDPNVTLDNNHVERALRGVVVGRKNHYGSKSKRGTEVAAMMYSLIESAKLVGANPEAYFTAALNAAFDGIEIPLPHEFKTG